MCFSGGREIEKQGEKKFVYNSRDDRTVSIEKMVSFGGRFWEKGFGSFFPSSFLCSLFILGQSFGLFFFLFCSWFLACIDYRMRIVARNKYMLRQMLGFSL